MNMHVLCIRNAILGHFVMKVDVRVHRTSVFFVVSVASRQHVTKVLPRVALLSD